MNTVYDRTMATVMAQALAANPNMSSDKAQMRLYLDTLKAMVPQCPKNRKVSRQELIEHVINYISDLQDTLQSESDSDSRPGSPMDGVGFSDSFNQQPQYGGYGVQPDQYSIGNQDFYSTDTDNVLQPQHGYYINSTSSNFGSTTSSYSGYIADYSGYSSDGSNCSAYSSGSH
ncbi:uncharacterized protein LOC119574041 [Penaeus monodon]|uniref:uncharacterized protein LOC119574041 n=1 Tax=Penaeus monodon TaxID=6687 RepID=UPI0018A79EF7|nr:uncharacterized protein LOC119574041 [Penaeus monodon]